MQVTFEGDTQAEIKAQIVEAGYNTTTKFSPIFQSPVVYESEKVPNFLRVQRLSLIKKLKDASGLSLLDAKNLNDFFMMHVVE